MFEAIRSGDPQQKSERHDNWLGEWAEPKRPDGLGKIWIAKQQKDACWVIKAALLPLLGNDRAEVERVFLIIKAQKEY
jgi:hypothetical protein